MELSRLLIVIGLVLAALIDTALGLVCILAGCLLLILPRLTTGRA